MKTRTLNLMLSAALAAAAAALAPAVHAAPADEVLAAYVKQAGAPASAERGQKFFTAAHGNDPRWTCATCHGEKPTGPGRDTMAEKALKPLAPAANPAALGNRAKVENYFKINCMDVVGRPCTAGEKADVIAWLLTLKP